MLTALLHNFLSFILIILTISVSLPSIAQANSTHQGKIIQVKDGDTAVISPIAGGQFFICRLYGIDAPEIPHDNKPGQPYGEESTRELKKLILGQGVTVEIRDRDKYGREVCVVRKDDKDMNLAMIIKGAAWAYRKYLKRPYASEYIDAEREARGKELGLWQQRNPVPPWEYRKGMR